MQSKLSITVLESILSEWLELREKTRVAPLAESTGLSGALIWKVSHGSEAFCLKRWPGSQFTIGTLGEVHAFMRHVNEYGFRLAPLPQTTRGGSTVVVAEGDLWDLTSWMPGEALSRQEMCDDALHAAIRVLAEFHAAASTYTPPRVDVSPGLRQRLNILQSLGSVGIDELIQSAEALTVHPCRSVLNEIAKLLQRALPAVLSRLERGTPEPLPMQWCLRDVKYDHFLFEAGEPSGLIDFGAAAVDSVAGDLARLIGSLSGVERGDWSAALGVYQTCRPLTPAEVGAVRLFDEGGVLVAIANWLRWLAVERREFGNAEQIESQLDWLRNRLRDLS